MFPTWALTQKISKLNIIICVETEELKMSKDFLIKYIVNYPDNMLYVPELSKNNAIDYYNSEEVKFITKIKLIFK